MKKIIGVLAVLLVLAICVVIGGLIIAGPAIDRAFNNVENKNILTEHNIPTSPNLIFHKQEQNPKGGNLNEIPMFNVERDFEWSDAGMSFVEALKASDYTIFQFFFRKKDEQLANPKASTTEGIREEVVDFYLENLLKSGWVLVLLPGYDRTGMNKVYIKGDTMPLLFQNTKNPSQLLILDSKRGLGMMGADRTARIEENKGQEMPVYWLVLYTNPKITKPLPALTKVHGEKYIGATQSEAYLELLENQVFIIQYFELRDPQVYVGKYTIKDSAITLISPEMAETEGSIVGNKITFKSDRINGLNGEFVK